MFRDNSKDIFLEMIKSNKFDKKQFSSNKSKGIRYSAFLTNQSICSGIKGDLMDIISKLPTYKKICLLQGLLKEIKSIKERLEDNMDNLLKKISKNCFYYYQSKIEMKKIYDYCQSNNREINLNYNLCENSKEVLSDNFKVIYDMLFLLRENYDIMLIIIKNCGKNSFESLSDFLVNFFYENTVNSSFNEEELMVIIYLLIEEFIIVKMPKSLISFQTINENYFFSDFLKYIFKYITRKVDVRNFTCMILSSYILKLEESNCDLNINIRKNTDNSSIGSKGNSMVTTTVTDEFVVLVNSEDLDISSPQEFPNLKINKSLSPVISTLDKIYETQENNASINNDKKINYNFPEINQFFYDNDVTLDYLNTKLEEYEKKSEQDTITLLMRNYLDLQISLINLENSEIFSNCTKIIELKNYISSNNKENPDITMNLIIDNYTKITKFIDEIIESFKDNIISIPYIVKSISYIIELLLNKKYNKEGKNTKDIDYTKIMILSNYFLGQIILPIIKNPNFNGIITTAVISKITRENLNIIYNIIKTMLSGKLFSNKKDFEYTIFNQYIINTLPKIFNIIISINQEKNFILPNQIKKLIDSCEDINNPERDIKYDYFKENQEHIQQQSICFCFENIDVLVKSVSSCNEIFKDKKYEKFTKLFENFITLNTLFQNDFINFCKKDYFLIEKIAYSPYLTKLINNIMQDNIFVLMQNIKNDELSIFKNCLADLLSYVNILNKENFNYFMQKNTKKFLSFEKKLKKEYPKIIFEDSNSEKNNSQNQKENINQSEMIYLKDLYEDIDIEEKEDKDEDKDNKDANFKDIIFPQIIDIVKSELSNNLDTEKAKRIVFCSSYLQTHMSNLPLKYTENNYSLLLMEVIQKSEEIIKELNLSILNNFYLKVTGGEKLNMIISSNLLQIKKIEKWVIIEYLFEKINHPCKLLLKKANTGIIQKVEYKQVDHKSSYIHSIQSFIKNFPNFRKYSKDVNDIIELEEKVELDIALNSYFKDLKSIIKKEQIVSRFTKDEIDIITQELENYIIFKLYDKLFPKEPTKNDIKFYKKCCRLDFIRPENLIKDKNMINENLWKASMLLINEMDEKLTPADKVKSFGKALTILQNSITFSSGKNDLGIDDTVSFLIYIILKSKPKNIFSNSKYCQLLLNPKLAKKQYGILLSQMEMVKNIIFDMKYKDLIGISEEQFGKDEE